MATINENQYFAANKMIAQALIRELNKAGFEASADVREPRRVTYHKNAEAVAEGFIQKRFVRKLCDDMKLAIEDGSAYPQYATVGTLCGFAMRDGDCPIEAHKRNDERNAEIDASEFAKYRQHEKHKTVWINTDAICISAHKQAPVIRVNVVLGEVVKIEGKIYEIHPDNNHNFKLVQI